MGSSATLTPRMQDAADFVRAGIRDGRFPRGRLLPSLRRLASEAHVSLVTMWKAVNWLREQGHLAGPTGRVPRVVAPGTVERRNGAEIPATVSAPTEPEGAAGRLTARLRRDILNGRFSPGARLPLMKELEHRYGCTGRTLRRVLRHLHEDGLVEPFGRGHAVRSLPMRVSQVSVALLVMQEYIDRYFLGMPGGHDYIRDAELHAAHASVRLSVVPLRTSDSGNLAVLPDSRVFTARESAGIEGYIYILPNPDQNDDLFKKIIRTGKPLSILNQDGRWVPPTWLRNHPVRIIPMGVTDHPGCEVGRHLIRAGHQKVAYFSPYHPVPWSVNRMAGLRTSFAQAGYAEGLVPMCVDLLSWASSYADFQGEVAEAIKVRIDLPKGYEPRSLGVDFRAFETYLRSMVEGAIVMRAILRSVFERALQNPAITAWVAANDNVAVVAQDFLREHRVRVPQDISLVSFDDSFLAVANQITSYNFNMPAIMAEALRHCLRGPSAAPVGRARTIEVEGLIVDRGSTGPASKKL